MNNIEYFNKKQKENYDRLHVLLKKGNKANLKILAKYFNFKGMNTIIVNSLIHYIKYLIDEEIKNNKNKGKVQYIKSIYECFVHTENRN